MSLDLLETQAPALLTESDRRVWAFLQDDELISSHRGQSRLALINPRHTSRRNRPLTTLPGLRELLTAGGDSRIVCGPDGRNRYGCSPLPESAVLAYGSSTASTISPAAFAAASTLRDRLCQVADEEMTAAYERELDRVRRELAALCGLGDLPGLETILGASGTDLHLFASQLMSETESGAPLIVRVEAAETGRGVPDALAGRHFGDCAPLGDLVLPNAEIDGRRSLEIREIKCRQEDGSLRSAAQVDAEVERAVLGAVAAGRRVLLTMVDVSKTGLLAPSPSCVLALRTRFPESVEVLVDACQFRLAPRTLRAYLERDFLVAITGSKFVTGPTFCGALFVPHDAAQRLRHQTLPRGLKSYSARADWPRDWTARTALNPAANHGLLLRWEAALSELRAFRRLAEPAIAAFLATFTHEVTRHIAKTPAFEFVPAPVLDRGPFASTENWDQMPTIFSFLLRRSDSSNRPAYLKQDETKKIHELLREDAGCLAGKATHAAMSSRCEIGQPVPCGIRDGISVSALRLCASSRLIVDALSPNGRGAEAVIAEALAVLDKAAFLTALPLTGPS
jgi:hypothetical protein